jgi:uncharacterized protein YndB with AHSA1/START domain
MRVVASTTVAAPPEAVWAMVDDPTRYLHFMDGVTRWEVDGGPARGPGARYRILMRVGSAEVGGLVEVVEHRSPWELAWTSVTGVDQRGRWRIRARPPRRDGTPCTAVELRLAYGLTGAGIGGWLAERLAAPTVTGHLRRSLEQLRRQVEHEQARAAAAARRAEREGRGRSRLA